MTNHQSPITPPPELVEQWADMIATHTDTEIFGAAAQWGWDQRKPEIQAAADQELAMQFFGVPLIPPLDCTDPQSWIAERIYQMGADQTLEACVRLAREAGLGWFAVDLMRARRPKPPSLKEQALDDLHIAFDRGCLSEGQADTIRRALEALDD